jgi:phytoene dehydrogenase-like protein
MGGIAKTLAQAIIDHGGQVLYRKQINRIIQEGNRPVAVETNRGESFPADIVIANLTPWSIKKLLGDNFPLRLQRLPERPQTGWGAFVVYVGIDGAVVPTDFPLHHQVIVREPLGEGNSLFISISPAWDQHRGPEGHRAVTISTHTRLGPWWDLFEHDRPAYEARKSAYTDRILAAAETALPRLRDAAQLVMPGTPVTFQRFTRRQWGWVGGFPQTDLFQSWGPRLSPNLWMVGDSIFPGQSTAAVALGGLRVANTLLHEMIG